MIASLVEPGRAGEPRSFSIDDGDIRWHVTVRGRGSVALLVHGAGASSHSFAKLSERLARRFTVVAVDLPGHADTRVQGSFDPSLRNVAQALGRLDDRLELRPELVVGHSAGAAVLLRWVLDDCARPPVVVAIAPALVPIRGLVGSVLRRAAAALGGSLAPNGIALGLATTARVESMLRGLGSGLDHGGVEAYRKLMARPDHVRGALSMMARWDLVPLYEALPRVHVPVLVLAGAADRAISVAQVREATARMRRATLVVIRGAGHLLHEEQPDRVASEITEYLDRQQRPDHASNARVGGVDPWPC